MISSVPNTIFFLGLLASVIGLVDSFQGRSPRNHHRIKPQLFAKTASAKRKSNIVGGGGFGKIQKVQPQSLLSKKARRLLKKHGQNVDLASQDSFESSMALCFDDLSSESEKHAARVKATWGTVALSLPCDYARTKGKVMVSTVIGCTVLDIESSRSKESSL